MSVIELPLHMAHVFINFLYHPLVRGYLWTCFISGLYSGYHGSMYMYNKLQVLPGVTGRVFRKAHTPFRQFVSVGVFSLLVGGFYVCKPFISAMSIACSPFTTILSPVSKDVIQWVHDVIKVLTVVQDVEVYDSSTSASSDEDAPE